ncbi:NAD-dependent epimerase/dehydratase family protein [Leptothermofonsia sp. ETS-13]|uniref:NAD-dependent epimerase/dehydratase family protein n=1 Tax=Leptothermofonsia sp. ETS-13 TaxID=3035696 RepID=UPI003BA23B24
MSAKSYLVTGGTGFIGSALVRRLVREGHRVRVFDNQSRGVASRLADVEKDIEFVAADIRDPEAVQKAIYGIESVCHLAFVNGTEFFYTKPDLVLDVGVKGMVNVLDGCMKHGVGELVLASSSEVYQTPPTVPTDETAPLCIPDPWNPRYSYGAGKLISEIMAINYGRKHFERVLIFRPHNVFGPDMGWEHVVPQLVLRMKALCQESTANPLPFPIQGTGNETRAFVFIDDFIDGLMLMLKHGEHLGIYHIGTMEEISIASVAHEIAKYFNRPIEIVPGELAKGGTPRRCPDIGRLAALGYKPQYTFAKALPIVAKWYDENSHQAPDSNN